MKKVLIDLLELIEPYKNIKEDIREKTSPVLNYGVTKESLCHMLYGLYFDVKKQILLITYDDVQSNNLYNDLKGLGVNNVEIFPKKEVLFYNIDAVSFDNSNQRLKVISKLINNEKMIVIASYEAIFDKIINKSIYKENTISIDLDTSIDTDILRDRLIKSGYERVDQLEGLAQFSIRGGIIDIYPTTSENPIRIELFGDEIDTIRNFDINTQRSIENLEKVIIPPIREILIIDSMKEDIIKGIKKDLKKSKDNEKAVNKFNEYLEKLEEGSHINNLDMILPYIDNKNLNSIIDYFNKDSLIFIDEYKRIKENLKVKEDASLLRNKDLLVAGEILPSHENIDFAFEEVFEKSKEFFVSYNSSLLVSDPYLKPKKIYNYSIKTTINYQNQIKLLVDDLNHYIKEKYKILILSGSLDRAERLKESLLQKDILSTIIDDNYKEQLSSSHIYISVGSIQSGFEYINEKVVIISDKQVFERGVKKKRKKNKLGESIINLADLSLGSYVVHEDHGIGVYEGIEQLEIQGIKKDYLSIRYKDADKLYIPVDQMNLIQKYIGSDAKKPKVNKLNSGDWQKTKIKAKKAVEDMAKDLIELYAKRETLSGYKFAKDTPWQLEFEDRFPYKETEGQLKAIEEIKADMETKKPMDRLLCADVGYGKTEVALRAAFKAVMDGKQVAFLVPTTILAQQHYETMVERFKDFPIKVDMLSRFRTPHRQKLIIEGVKNGTIDIIVGTHRLLSKDIKYKDLGLLIIDEEQRFGVKDKEKIKQIKENVDVLILTATPIPRTLHMSLAGIRDMSVIEDPPAERYPIQTYVVEYNEQMIRSAILKELARGGQVYFVYNRVATIDKIAHRLKKLVPEANFGVAHGQMSERALEKEMLAFQDREHDVLVCTTIIETGLDLPNVNTIIIYDSDKMGLSQLYQLRGRVGRSNRIAYGYFTYEKDKVLTEVAEKRLKAIKEFTEFGSGFKIAMRDLEIRGAGNLLGTMQHGHIEAIGYDLYVKFLEEAVRRLKGEEIKEKVNTSIDLNIDGYIPDKFIKDTNQKIEMYKKIASIDSKEYYMDLVDEIIDRYGDMPKQVSNLMDISYIKNIASEKNIINIQQTSRGVRLDLSLDNKLTPESINKLDKDYKMLLSYDFSMKPNILYKKKDFTIKDLKLLISRLDS